MTWVPEPEHLICRDLQHSWSPHTARKEKRGYVRSLLCSRCGSIKHQTLDRRGYLLTSRMTYPQGYVRPGLGRMSKADRADLRLGNLNA